MNVTSLHIYPLKSARAVDLSSTGVDQRGLLNDRRYLLVGESGGFLTQREIPELAKLIAKPAPDGLKLSFEGSDAYSVLFKDFVDRMTVQIWSSTVQALVAGQATNDLISEWLQRPVKLVHMDEAAERYVNPRWVDEPAQVNFAANYTADCFYKKLCRFAFRQVPQCAHMDCPFSIGQFIVHGIYEHLNA